MTATGQPSALDMARNLVAAIQRSAEHIDADPLGAHLDRTGDRGFAAAEMAFRLAMVSIAEDFHRVADVVCKFDAWADQNDAKATGQPWTLQGAVDDARATREHMKRWAEGAESHQGESP
jgi:hypothetical protein